MNGAILQVRDCWAIEDWCQIWMEPLAVILTVDKLDWQTLNVLMTLWRHLHPEKQYWHIGQVQKTKSDPVKLEEVTWPLLS